MSVQQENILFKVEFLKLIPLLDGLLQLVVVERLICGLLGQVLGHLGVVVRRPATIAFSLNLLYPSLLNQGSLILNLLALVIVIEDVADPVDVFVLLNTLVLFPLRKVVFLSIFFKNKGLLFVEVSVYSYFTALKGLQSQVDKLVVEHYFVSILNLELRLLQEVRRTGTDLPL